MFMNNDLRLTHRNGTGRSTGSVRLLCLQRILPKPSACNPRSASAGAADGGAPDCRRPDAGPCPWRIEIASPAATPTRHTRNSGRRAEHAATILPSPAPGYGLTPREEDVLALMAEGKSNRQIAVALTLAVSTVKCHVSNILSKLDAENRTEAVAIVLQKQRPAWM